MRYIPAFAVSFMILPLPAYAGDFGNIASGIGAASSIIGNFQNEKTNRHLSEMQAQQARQAAANRAAANRRAQAAKANAEAAEAKAKAAAEAAAEAQENEKAEGELFSCDSRMKRLKRKYRTYAPDMVDTFNDYTLRVGTLSSAKAKALTCQRFLADAEADFDQAAADYKQNQLDKNKQLDVGVQHKALDYSHEENMEKISISRLREMNSYQIQQMVENNAAVKARIRAMVEMTSSDNDAAIAKQTAEVMAKISADNVVSAAVKAAAEAMPDGSEVNFDKLLSDKNVKEAIFESAKGAIGFRRS